MAENKNKIGTSRGHEGVLVNANIITTVIDMQIVYINELCNINLTKYV